MMTRSAPQPRSLPDSPYIQPLEAIRARDVARVGCKAANLGELAAAGFNVPRAAVVTTAAFDEMLAGLRGAPSAEAILGAPVPSPIASAIRAALGDLGQGALVVRSSSVAEDRGDASFAGLYESVLDVTGPAAVIDAVRRCWASAYSERVRAYRERTGAQGGSMAVVIQRLVSADAAGVCFTANPTTGARSEAVVNAVTGLGERLVGGEATPDEWLVQGDDTRCTAAPENAVDERQVRAVVDLARAVERHFGEPQDVEWALADDAVHLLQARPITALPEAPVDPIPMELDEPTEGFWMRDASHAPKPGTPLFWSLFQPILDRIHRPLFEEAGFLLEDLRFHPVGGLLYLRMVPLGGKDAKPPPRWLLPILRRVIPSLRRRVNRGVHNVRTGWCEAQLERWWDEWRPALDQQLADLRDKDLGAMSNEELLEHVDELCRMIEQVLSIHTRLSFSMIPLLGRFCFAAEELLGWDTAQSLCLFVGLSHMSTEPARQLAPLAAMAAANPTIMRALDEVGAGGQQWTERVRADAPEFAEAWAQYVRRYGCRAIRYEIIDPNLDETPEVLLGALRGMLQRDYDPTEADAASAREHEAALAEARRALRARSPEERERFEHRLEAAKRAYSVREDSEFFTISWPFGVFRCGVLELGRRLLDAGVLDRRDDVFFLELAEAAEALRTGGDFAARIRRRRGQHVWAAQRVGSEPATFGTPPEPPGDLSWLPPEAADLVRSMVWFGTHQIAPQERRGDGLTGIAAGRGSYEGTVRVIADENEFHKIRPGDVLVCPITSPVWSVLFPSVGALVTDEGGLLSHSAIIAREYRIPAVVGTGAATTTLRDGQRVRVDGDAGRVEVLS